MLRIDAHQHLWRYDAAEFGWIGEDMSRLRRDFLMSDLLPLLERAHVDGTVAVQARQTLEETEWLLSLAAQENSPILGVVGWLPVASPDLPTLLARFRDRTQLKGLRHVVQSEPPGFLDTPDFNRGIEFLRHHGLTYDLLLYADQLEEAIRFVDRHPAQAFVLDHLGKPDIRGAALDDWARNIRELARRTHVTCKVSGMVTEADWTGWSGTGLKAYFDVALEAFGPERLMIGTDWPVLTVACSYTAWWQTVESWLAPLSEPERSALLGGTAARIYSLGPTPPEQIQAQKGNAG